MMSLGPVCVRFFDGVVVVAKRVGGDWECLSLGMFEDDGRFWPSALRKGSTLLTHPCRLFCPRK